MSEFDIIEMLDSAIEHLSQSGRGILAADESSGTIAKRFADIGVENTEANRRDYRLLLANTPHLEEYVSGVILFEETFEQKNAQGQTIPEILAAKDIMPGIKVDKGLVDLHNTELEKISQGLDGLVERVTYYRDHGARFAKWRNVFTISDHTPSYSALRAGAEVLARYAAICQSLGIVPIVEPEILIDGDHSIEDCADTSKMVMHEVFDALYTHGVCLEQMILKPSMVTCGKQCAEFSTPEDVALFTLHVFRNTVPAAVPTINFLSGGQTAEQATANLNAINQQGPQPWNLGFSFSRALQEVCLKTWGGKAENVEAAQMALLKRAHLNSLASFGDYSPELEAIDMP